MNFQELSAFAEIAEPTKSKMPGASVNSQWLKKFRKKIDVIAKNESLVFVFPDGGNESLIAMEMKGDVISKEFPFHIPDECSGLFILNQNTGGQGWHKAFDSMESLFAFLRLNQTLSNCPTLASTGCSDTMHFFPRGVSERDQCLEVPFGTGSSLSIESLIKNLDFFATDKILNHPRNRSLVWSKSDKYYPAERAEKNIQDLLVLVLQSNYQAGLVYDELPVPSGRTDVIVEERDGASFVRFLIELKAVRAFAHTGTSYPESTQLANCKSGIIQALANGEDLNVDMALLCAYDLRPNPADTMRETIKLSAKPYDIDVRWYKIVKSSSADRVDRAIAYIDKQPKA